MAGIGFELKKIFKKKSVAAKLTGALYSILATIGHMLIIVTALILVQLFINASEMSEFSQNLFAAIILYCFVFPLIFTSGLNIVLSRYTADKLWVENREDVFASLLGAVGMYCVFASIPAIIFLSFSKMSLALSVFSYILYISIGVLFILMVYVSALKEYKQVSIAFFVGMLVVFILCYAQIAFFHADKNIVTYLIASFDLGMIIILTGIMLQIKKYFFKASKKYFSFILYIKKYPMLFIGNTLYTMALYVQNFVFWANNDTQLRVLNFINSPNFDLATAFGVYTILPSVVLFVVRTETSFYDYYKEFIVSVNTKTGGEIRLAKNHMKKRMWSEYFFVFEVQTLISLLLIAIGLTFLPKFRIASPVTEMFPFLTFGYLLTYFMFLACTLLQYFENYKASLQVMILFFTLNTTFNILTVLLKSEYYGIGMMISSIPAFILSLKYLKQTLDTVEYRIFCGQTLMHEEKPGRLDALVDFLNNTGDEKGESKKNSQ